MMPAQSEPVLCHRCGAVLHPGEGNFHVIRIEAVADPTPPDVRTEDLPEDSSAEMRRLIETMEGMSERELREQVYTRMEIELCGPCFREWLEDPVGRKRREGS